VGIIIWGGWFRGNGAQLTACCPFITDALGSSCNWRVGERCSLNNFSLDYLPAYIPSSLAVPQHNSVTHDFVISIADALSINQDRPNSLCLIIVSSTQGNLGLSV